VIEFTYGGRLFTDGQIKNLPYDPIVNPFPGVDKIRNGGLNPDRNNFGPRSFSCFSSPFQKQRVSCL
jgi:hypothetical protein